MISYDELFSSRSLAPDPWFPQLANPDREILVRECYSIFSVHYGLETEPVKQSLIEFLRIVQIGNFNSNVTNSCLNLIVCNHKLMPRKLLGFLSLIAFPCLRVRDCLGSF